MLKAYKYRVYPTKEQKVFLAKTFGCVRFAYNYYLDRKIKLYEEEKKSMSKTDCNNDLNRNLKEAHPWLREVDKFALTNAVYCLDAAFQNFFRDKSVGFPKFKSKHNHNYSYTTNVTNGNIKADFENGRIQLPKLKFLQAKLHRVFTGPIKSATLSQVPSGNYFVSILVEEETIVSLPKGDKAIGFDLGIKEFMIDSDGNHIPNPKYIQKYENMLTKEQRRLAHKKKGSQNWQKQRKKVARIHEKIKNAREDFSNQLSSKIIKENQIIISEDLRIRNMIKNHHLAKSITDAAWGNFLRKIAYKADWYGRTYHKINSWFASSQICFDCGKKNTKIKLLTIREWECEACGAKHQRDENAAKNILGRGLEELAMIV